MAADGVEGVSGISFVILYQIRLCRAGMRIGCGGDVIAGRRDDKRQDMSNKS